MQTEKELTIATYNVQFAINRDKIVANTIAMAQEGVTIFCLEEIINTPNETFIIKELLQRLGGNWQAAYHVGDEQSRVSIGTAILWDTKIFTLKRTEKILLPKLKKFDLHEKFYYKIIGASAVPLQRRATSCYFTYNGSEFRVTCVHVDNVGGPVHRMKQITFLLSELNKEKTPKYEIVCGDFNTFDLLKTGYEKKLLQKKFGNVFKDASEKVGWTSDIYQIDFNTSIRIFPWFIKTFNIHIRRRLDYIWVKNLEVISCKKLKILGSDHFPVIAKLKIK